MTGLCGIGFLGSVLIQAPGEYRICGSSSNHGIVVDADGEVQVLLDHATVNLEGTMAQALVVKKGNLTIYLSGVLTIDDYRAPDNDDGLVGLYIGGLGC